MCKLISGRYKVKDKSDYGQTEEEQLFSVALELSLTWINRILFLKLLEGQLITYHKGNKDYRFLNIEMIHDFDELYKLFHQVLARNINERTANVKQKYARVPYLNSSLFEISELEDLTIKINSLDNSEAVELIGTTILKEEKKKNSSLPPLEYLFKFLDAYDFASEGGEDIAEDNKTIINASVLGKVFEKINGYKDGSIFTPGFITMYMARQSLRLAVVQKFNEYFKTKEIAEVNKFEDIYNHIEKADIQTANDIINSLHVCDPAVGSGHFLVSVLNELIVIKSELGILVDKNGKRLKDYEIEVDNDELIISDENGIFDYNYQNKESQRVQETIFSERQTIIENCLFGVDINPNSVKICRLRLWIELLKSSYYKAPNYTELETLPNIDINIKCGNSLISRFALDADLSKALKSINYDIKAYRGFVADYKNEKNREVKRGLQKIIDDIKSDFRTNIDDPFKSKIAKARGGVENILTEINTKQQWGEKIPKTLKDKLNKATLALTKLENEKENILSNVIYKNAFEWRFEFPEVLNDKGEFEGFDVVIGNPPYIQLQSMGKDADALETEEYKTFARTGDIYSLFYEKGNDILNDEGILAFITSNKWMRADYGLNTRKYIVENTNPLLLIDFGMVLVFDNATVLSNILLFQKDANINKLEAIRIPNDFDLKLNLKSYFESNYSVVSVNENAWVINSKKIQEIKTKVESQGIKIKEWNIKINRGILTGFNEAFIIDGKTKDSLIANDSKSEELIKPILRGQDIKAWQPEFDDLWVIATFPSCKIDIEEYPAIKEHLLSFGYDRIEQSGKKGARKKTNNKWFETQDSIVYFEDFKKPKVIYPNMTKFLPFVYDEKGYITNQKCFIITSEDKCLQYLIAFFNSNLFKFCFKDNFPELLGETFELSKVFFEQIPVKQITPEKEQPFIDIVDKILIAKQQSQDTADLEKQIDEMVYKLYDLTEEEIAIIENKK